MLVKRLLFLVLWIACGTSICAQSTDFPLPPIPDTLRSKQQRVEYLCEHFWDCYDFKDLRPLQTPRVILDYIFLLSNIPHAHAVCCLPKLLDRAMANQPVFEQLIFLFDRYLYSPDSQFQNEELYLPVLEYVVQSPQIDSVYKIYPQAQLRLVLQNRIGRPANDFTLIQADGGAMRLYDIESPYILLYFNNPDCSVCEKTKMDISESPIIASMFQKGLLAIVAVYPGDNIEMWRQTPYPKLWINGYDKDGAIYSEWLYAIKTMPAIYLLDENKTVLMKERVFADIEQYISQRLGVIN